VIVERRGSALWLILNRPHRLNAFTWAMRDAMLAAVRDRDQDVEAVVLTGTGRGFCAGVDVSVLVDEAGDTVEGRRSRLQQTHELVRLFWGIDVPVVALVNGVAAGGGWSLALACDHIVAADGARFVTAFTRLGLVPDLGGAYTLSRRVGATRAKSVIMRGQQLDALEALEIGAVDWVAPAAELESRFEELLPQIVATGKRWSADGR
jgi:2-(1,2-epoxy-1,2-dihydrophenyl)acetyl-CoA isomerase